MKMAHPDDLEEIARIVIDCGYRLHKEVGPGLLESVYEVLLAAEVADVGLSSRRQVPINIVHKGVVVDNAFKADLLVENKLLIELKSTEAVAPVHGKQVLTYLRLMDLPLGFLMNFGMATFKDGLKRIANNYYGRIR
jgi:iron complex transport system substrate-binding protein